MTADSLHELIREWW